MVEKQTRNSIGLKLCRGSGDSRKVVPVKIIHFVACLFLLCYAGLSPAASVPSWNDMPSRLRSSPGVARSGKFYYATGAARTGRLREDKSHDTARRRSFLNALQLLHLEVSCRDLLERLPEKEHKKVPVIFSFLVPPLKIRGTVVLRQWEEDNRHFTSIGVPAEGIMQKQCFVSSLDDLIERYISPGNPVSLEGLEFSLVHTRRFSRRLEDIRKRIAGLLRQTGIPVLSRAFESEEDKPVRVGSFLRLKALFLRSERYAELARKAAGREEWTDALSFAGKAIRDFPVNGRAWLTVADYFLARGFPAMAMMASGKAMRDPAHLLQALRKMRESLIRIDNPEVSLFSIFIEDAGRHDGLPDEWRKWSERFSEESIAASLVLLTGGTAFSERNPVRPGEKYAKAVSAFQKAESGKDLLEVSHMAASAIEETPSAPETHNLMATVLRMQDACAAAIPFLWHALDLRPDYDIARANIALCTERLGIHEAALYYLDDPSVKNSTSRWVQEVYSRIKEGK